MFKKFPLKKTTKSDKYFTEYINKKNFRNIFFKLYYFFSKIPKIDIPKGKLK